MEFGKIAHPEWVDFTLVPDHSSTRVLLQQSYGLSETAMYVGFPQWNKSDLKGFYPQGTKDELFYYSRQFNSIELNTTFYNLPDERQIRTWKEKTPEGFKFFPKLSKVITHEKWLSNTSKEVEIFCNSIKGFEDRLGTVFMQLHENFAPKDFSLLKNFVQKFPVDIPLAIELRNVEWFNNSVASQNFSSLFKDHQISNIIIDTAGRRDLIHMHLTSSAAFIRFICTHHPLDISRLDNWLQRLIQWKKYGIQNIYFFIHQSLSEQLPFMAAHFISQWNLLTNQTLKVPEKSSKPSSLFD